MTAALALTLAACSKDDDGLTPQPAEQQPTEQTTGRGIPFTATISIGEGGMTRALADGGTTLTATWEEGEKVALIHNGVSDELTVVNVSGGKATIEGDITGSPSDGDAVTIIYPATAAKGTTGEVKASLLKTQEGTLAAVSEKYDVRKGSGTLKVGATATLTDDVAMANQFAVWKLTVPEPARNLCILADNEAIAGATLEGEQGTEFTVAVPAVSAKTITVVASDDDNNCYYYKKDGINLAAGKYYRSSPAMSPVGKSSTDDPQLVTGDHSSEPNWIKNISGTKTVVLCGLIAPQCCIIGSDDVTIILMGTNSLNTSGQTGGIGSMVTITGDKTLTITGTGSLTAKGGIGGPCFGTYKNRTDYSCGNIIISGGILDLTGGKIKDGNGAAAIGTGNGGTCGNITITEGVTRLTATKSGSATHSIGKGSGGSCGTVTIGGTVYWDGSNYQNGGDTYLTQSTLIYEP